ncbi:Histone-like transcription factor [Giardia muris]|uniref:Histone-like transcription factor n=1 Tax=Giardia muris TaxID=5742 RepID=A0A4Z1T2C0_GIAMU|nr:Histone-like transcription factor [Giardia muris]|eukprot:TNJ26739.1 Histone-like transcription factor [Giardia muris]
MELPVAKVKRIIKATVRAKSVAQGGVLLVGFAAQYITKYLLEAAHREATRMGRKTVSYDDIVAAVEKTKGLAFLRETFPKPTVIHKPHHAAQQ